MTDLLIFGRTGQVALELARSGADVAGVVSLHGGISTPAPAAATLGARALDVSPPAEKKTMSRPA